MYDGTFFSCTDNYLSLKQGLALQKELKTFKAWTCIWFSPLSRSTQKEPNKNGFIFLGALIYFPWFLKVLAIFVNIKTD
jgi:hypothetical protein